MKKLLVKAGLAEVSDKDVATLFKEIDTNDSKSIDIDEFMAWSYSGDRLNTESRSLIVALRKERALLNLPALVDMFRGLAKTFQPACSQNYLE